MVKSALSKTIRADELMVARGHAESAAKAAALIMSGVVIIDERRVEKPSDPVRSSAEVRIKGGREKLRYVSRGGVKLEHALHEFGIDPTGLNCLDVGSSTGGFTDCLLQHGAARVVAIDAGTNQLDWRIRSDDRVEVRENTNARTLGRDSFDVLFDLVVMDVSFISATKILPVIARLLADAGRLVLLIKPQFEAERSEVASGGIVTDDAIHQRVIREVGECAASFGLFETAVIESPILGKEGNKEFLALYAGRIRET